MPFPGTAALHSSWDGEQLSLRFELPGLVQVAAAPARGDVWCQWLQTRSTESTRKGVKESLRPCCSRGRGSCARGRSRRSQLGAKHKAEGLISIPTHAQPFCLHSQHRLLHGEGGLEPGGDRAAVGLVETNHHSLGSVLGLGGVQTGEFRQMRQAQPLQHRLQCPAEPDHPSAWVKEQTLLNNSS